ncbi:hypothetical protein [Salinisphaera aquimarina]|uniref:Uncharacterized protein n=1 Tax=Salinisphaera aquimarina TaxID=2094031 RepID=A0ABV7EP61_9GAMM
MHAATCAAGDGRGNLDGMDTGIAAAALDALGPGDTTDMPAIEENT